MAVAHDVLADIPVVDISGEEPEAKVAKQLVDSAATSGFVYIRNQGRDIPLEDIDHAFALVCSKLCVGRGQVTCVRVLRC